jgi:hypothetical protein
VRFRQAGRDQPVVDGVEKREGDHFVGVDVPELTPPEPVQGDVGRVRIFIDAGSAEHLALDRRKSGSFIELLLCGLSLRL